MRIPRHFLQIPWIYAVTQRPHHGPVQSPDYPRLASATKSQGHSILPRLCQFLSSFHLWIFRNHSPCSCVLPTRVLPGISLMSAIQPLKHLKRPSPQLWSLPIGSQTPKSQSILTPLTTHLLLSFPLQLPMATCTLLHSTPRPFQPRNSITTSMTKSYLQLLKLSTMATLPRR